MREAVLKVDVQGHPKHTCTLQIGGLHIINCSLWGCRMDEGSTCWQCPASDYSRARPHSELALKAALHHCDAGMHHCKQRYTQLIQLSTRFAWENVQCSVICTKAGLPKPELLAEASRTLT